MIKKSALALALLAGFAANANAGIDFTLNYALANAAEGYAPGAPFNAPLSAVTDELKFTAESLLVFNSGTPFLAGSTFTDYIAVRVDQLFNNGIANSDVYNFPPGFNDRQITAIIVTSGVFVADTDAIINGLQRFDIIYDAGDNVGAAFTNAVFSSLNTFIDGTLVEQGVALLPGSGGNTGTTVPDGSVDLNVQLADLMDGGDFEVDTQGSVFTKIIYALTNGNNALCSTDGGTQTCTSTEAAIAAFFQSLGYAGAVEGATSFFTRTDGSLEKAIPEPATLALMGMGLLGMGFAARRRKSAP